MKWWEDEDFEDEEQFKKEKKYADVVPRKMRYNRCERKNRLDEHSADRQIKKAFKSRGVKLYSYCCMLCGGWHLTSMEQACN